MDEFQNRMKAQREILNIVNGYQLREELCGLSEQAISRWAIANELGANAKVVTLLRRAAELLSFLATKSQEQITDEYRARMEDVSLVIKKLRCSYNLSAPGDDDKVRRP